MEPEKPKTLQVDVDQALTALAIECVRLHRRTEELLEGHKSLVAAHKTTTDTLEVMMAAQERILGNHRVAFRRIHGLLVGLGADFEGEELRELRNLFNLEPPEESPKTN